MIQLYIKIIYLFYYDFFFLEQNIAKCLVESNNILLNS